MSWQPSGGRWNQKLHETLISKSNATIFSQPETTHCAANNIELHRRKCMQCHGTQVEESESQWRWFWQAGRGARNFGTGLKRMAMAVAGRKGGGKGTFIAMRHLLRINNCATKITLAPNHNNQTTRHTRDETQQSGDSTHAQRISTLSVRVTSSKSCCTANDGIFWRRKFEKGRAWRNGGDFDKCRHIWNTHSTICDNSAHSLVE